jgi:predicted phosphodiesterase
VRVAALYDVHAMPHALEAVLADLGDVDAIVFGGDVFCGPLPQETFELVRSVDAQYVRGNCERDPDERLQEKLGPDVIEWARAWPTTLELDGVLYCHATPRDDMTLVVETSPDERFADALDGVDARLVVGGHTHMQFRRERWVNAGSVGMPYEGEVAAFWLIVRDEGSGGELVPEFRKTPFDVERAAAEIRASDWPGAEEFVTENLLAAPSRSEALAWFESRV